MALAVKSLVQTARATTRQSENDVALDRAAAAAYVADLTRELATIARRHRLDTLGYILDMARSEAEESIRPHDKAR